MNNESFKRIKKFKSFAEWKDYRKYNENRLAIYSSNKDVCTICKLNASRERSSHLMTSRRIKCSNIHCLTLGACPIEYKLLQCMNNDKCSLFSNHKVHNSEIPDTEWGICIKIKDEIRSILDDHFHIAPKRILIKLNKKFSKDRDVNRLPSLSQV